MGGQGLGMGQGGGGSGVCRQALAGTYRWARACMGWRWTARASFRQGSRSRLRVGAATLSSDIIRAGQARIPPRPAAPAILRRALRWARSRLPVGGGRESSVLSWADPRSRAGRERGREGGCPLCREWQLGHAVGTPQAVAHARDASQGSAADVPYAGSLEVCRPARVLAFSPLAFASRPLPPGLASAERAHRRIYPPF